MPASPPQLRYRPPPSLVTRPCEAREGAGGAGPGGGASEGRFPGGSPCRPAKPRGPRGPPHGPETGPAGATAAPAADPGRGPESGCLGEAVVSGGQGGQEGVCVGCLGQPRATTWATERLPFASTILCRHVASPPPPQSACPYPHSTDGDTKPQRVCHWPRVTRLIRDSRGSPRAHLTPSPRSVVTCCLSPDVTMHKPARGPASS